MYYIILRILRKSERNHINRSGVTSKEYVLPSSQDKAGDYTCKVTVGDVASSYSASSPIKTTGLSFGILRLIVQYYFSIYYMKMYGSSNTIRHNVFSNIGMNQETFKW